MAISKRVEINYILENLHFLLDSGLSLVECLDILAKRQNNSRIFKIKESVLQGKSFQSALKQEFDSKIPHILDMFIQIGESCGNLSLMIKKAVETDKQVKKIGSSFIGALSYPLFITGVALVMIALIMIGIVPKLIPVFRDLHVELPVYTRFFISTSNLLTNYGLYIFIFLSLFIILVVQLFRKSQRFQIKVENMILRTWGIRSLYVRYHTSIIALCIFEYLSVGYAIHSAIKIIGSSTSSFAYQNSCFSISEEIKAGKSLSESISEHRDIFPDWSDILCLASQTGRLANQFEKFYLENIVYLEKANSHIKKWSEPALMLFIGGIIALFAVSIISPIYSVVQNVRI